MGILVTVIILMIALNEKGGIMTDKKVMKRAAELGMVMKETSEPETQKESESQKTIEPTTETAGIKSEDDKNNVSTQKNATQEEEHQKLQNVSEASETDKDETDKNESSDMNETSGNDSKDFEITVRKGDVCRDVAGQLYDKGLVDDAEAFRIYMGQHGYAKKLHVGSFHIQKGMSYEEIAGALTK